MEQQFTIDPNIAYDVIELPSRGIYYPNKKKSVKERIEQCREIENGIRIMYSSGKETEINY